MIIQKDYILGFCCDTTFQAYAKYGDTNSRAISIALCHDIGVYTFDSNDVVFLHAVIDNTKIIRECPIKNNRVIVDLTPFSSTEDGVFICHLLITNTQTTKEQQTNSFKIYVEN